MYKDNKQYVMLELGKTAHIYSYGIYNRRAATALQIKSSHQMEQPEDETAISRHKSTRTEEEKRIHR